APRSRWARRSSSPAIRCSRSCSRARRTSSAGCSSRPRRTRRARLTGYPEAVTARRPAPFFLALGAAFAGLIGIISALTPEFADRYDLVQGVLPPGLPAAARVIALAFGFALIWLARGLLRRKRRAWQLAIVVVAVSAAAHLAKGLDVEEAAVGLVLLAALWRYRAQFTAPGDPAVLRPLARVLVMLGVVA